MMYSRMPKPWLCPSCGTEIGQVVYGELHINEKREMNTDETNLVIVCPNCGNRKIWYAQDKLSEIIRTISDETARIIVQRLKNNGIDINC